MCIHNTFYHSMIFKTITNDLGNAKLSINSNFKNLFNGDFFKKTSILSDSDIAALRAYNAEIERGVSPMTAYYRTMQGASDSAVNMARSAGNATVNIEAIGTTSKAATIATKALAVAGNMVAMWLISEGISAAIKLFDSLVTTLNEAKEKFDDQKTQLADYRSQLDTLGQQLSESKDKLEELNNIKLNGDITAEQLEELSTLKEQTAEYQAQYELLLAKTEAQKSSAQTAASELLSLRKQYEQMQDSSSFKIWDNIFNVTSFNPLAGGMITKGLEWFTSGFGKNENSVSNFFGEINDWTSGRTLYEMTTGMDTEDIENYKTIEEYLKKYKDIQIQLNDLYEKSGYTGLTDRESERLLKLKEELGDIAPELLEEYENNLSILELYKSDEYSEKIFEDAIKELEDENKKIMYALNSIDLENSSEDDIKDYVKHKLSDNGIDEELINSIIESADDYRTAAEMLKAGVVSDDVVSYFNPKDSLLEKLIPDLRLPGTELNYILKQVNPDTVEEWVQGLTDAEARIADSDEFEKALEERKKELNGALLSANDYAEALQSAQASIQKYEEENRDPISFSDIFSLENSEGALTTLAEISQSIDKIQNAYKTLSSAIDEYNENGYLSIDTIQSITELGSGYLDYLIDEEGNLRLDQEALQELTVARLRDMQAQMQQELISQIESIKNETDATNFAAQAYREKAESISMVTKAMLQNKVASLNISDTAKDEVLSAANKTLTQIDTMFDNAVAGVYANPADVIGGSSSSSSSSSSASSSSSEIDFMEYRLTEIENLANEVQNAIDEAANTADKNALIDQMERINSTKADTLAQTVKYYTQKANEYLQEIPESLRDAAKNGAIAVSEFAGDENVAVAEAIQNFRDMQGSIADATNRLSELRQELIELEKTKFDNLVNAFGDLTSIITNNTSVIQAQISYLEDAGERVGSGYYNALIEQSRLYLEQLQKERNALSDQLSSAMSKGVKYGSDEWYDMYSQIQNIDEQIISLTSDIENYDDSLRNLDWSIFDDTVDAAGRLTEQMDNIIDLLDTDKTSGDYNGYSADAVTTIGMYMEQMESAKYLISESNSEISKLEKSYASGKISVGEYTERLEALQDTLWSNISAYNEAEQSILDLAEARINEAVEAINTETEAEKNRIQALKDELQAEKELEDYKRSLEEKQADADSIQAQINARKGSTDAATIAEREKLEAQLAEKLKEIQQMQQDQAYEDTIEDLDRQEEAYEESQQKRIDALEKQLEDEQALLLTAMNTALLNASTVTSQLAGITQTYGVQIDSNITSPWKNASAYVKTFNQDGKISLDNMNTNVNNFSSNFTTQLGGIKTGFTDLQKKANTASTNISKSIGAIDTTKLSTMVSTLGKKIDTSGITGSIDTVKGKVDNLNTSLSNVLNKYESLATAQIKTPETTNSHLYAVQGTYNGNQVYYKTYTNKTEADKAAAQVRKIPELKSAQISVIQVYKNGGEIARYANGGELDNLAQTIGEDHISTIAWRDGERIITPEQNKAFLKLADLGSSMMQQGIMDNLTKLASMSFPSGFTKSVTSPTLNIENLLNVQGNVTKDSLPQLQSMLDKTKTEIFNEFGRMLLNKNARRPR